MPCEFGPRDDIFIDYVDGALNRRICKQFEAHYFVCADCFKTLQRLEQIIWLLHHRGDVIFMNLARQTLQ